MKQFTNSSYTLKCRMNQIRDYRKCARNLQAPWKVSPGVWRTKYWHAIGRSEDAFLGKSTNYTRYMLAQFGIQRAI